MQRIEGLVFLLCLEMSVISVALVRCRELSVFEVLSQKLPVCQDLSEVQCQESMKPSQCRVVSRKYYLSQIPDDVTIKIL